MKLFGLIGDPVEHSVSPEMHSAALNALGVDGVYLKKRVSSGDLFRVVRGASDFGFDGLNVTIPHKEDVVDFCLDIGEDAELAGAVNTLCFDEMGLVGYNTDVFGARKPVMDRINISDSVVALAGAGGASRAVSVALKDAGEIKLFNRTISKAKELSRELGDKGIEIEVFDLEGLEEEIDEADLFVDATSVGLGNKDESLVSKDSLHSDLVVFDLVYRPIMTKLLSDAEEVGCDVIRGYEMLVHQGAKSLEHWLGKDAPVEVMKESVLEELEK